MNQYIMCVAVQDGELEKYLSGWMQRRKKFGSATTIWHGWAFWKSKSRWTKPAAKGLLSLFEFVNKRIQEFCSLAD